MSNLITVLPANRKFGACLTQAVRNLLLFVMMFVVGYPLVARADSPTLPPPPVVQLVDTNRVNILTGSAQYEGPRVSIGPVGQGGLSYDVFVNSQTGNPWISTVKFNYIDTYSVTLLGSSEDFVPAGGGYSPKLNTGGSLTHSGSTFTYTKADGTVAIYNDVSLNCDFVWCTPGVVSSITYPSGEKLSFTLRTTSTFVGIQSINSNLGYQIKVNYQCASPSTATCYTTIYNVLAINTAVDYCDPTANSCASLTQSWPTLTYSVSVSSGTTTTSVTDAVGNTTNLVGSVNPTTFDATGSLQRPSGRHIDYVSLACMGCDPGLSTLRVSDGASSTYWQYGVVENSANQVVTGTVTDPLGRVREIIADLEYRRPKSDIVDLNGLHLETDYVYSGTDFPTKITFPEGNYTQYTPDSRGNVTEIRKVGKPGSGVADIVTSATYTSSCTSTNFRWCNKPLTVTDPNGNTTTYTYSDDHGGVLTETGPAVGGVQPQTRYTYEARYAWYKNSSATGPLWGTAVWNSFNWTASFVQAATPVYVLTQVSKCMSGSSCTGTSQEQLTVNAYTTGSSSVATNLQPASVTQKNGSGTLVATVSSTYDMYGNVTAKTDPNGNTSAYFYDLNRQQVGAVGPDPDGGGALKYPAVKTTYDIDARVAKVEQGTVTSQSSMSSFDSLLQKTSDYQSSYFAPVTLATSFVASKWAAAAPPQWCPSAWSRQVRQYSTVAPAKYLFNGRHTLDMLGVVGCKS